MIYHATKGIFNEMKNVATDAIVYMCTNNKQYPRKKFCISAMVARISAKLSDFLREYSRNICFKFYWNNWYGSTEKAV